MASFIEPAGDHILVADIDRETTIDGIVLPENQREQEMVFGLVIEKGLAVSPLVHVQDCIAYGPYAGKNVVIDGVQFRIIREGHIEFYVRTQRVWVATDPIPNDASGDL
jgi:co-chaperonin GroES (HSP10)